jgi:ABC-type multidrug transport system ATPase subunit
MLRAEGLRHAFGRIRALDDISFALAAGETLTILGPNGAGKTTLLRVLAGLIHPQGGRVALEGGRRAVGWIGHAAHLYGHLTVRENILFWAALYDVPRGIRVARSDAVLARVGLADRARTSRCARCRAACCGGPPSPARWCTTRACCC